MSDFLLALGRTDDALDTGEEAVRVLRESDEPTLLAYASDNLGDLLTAAGRTSEAVITRSAAVDAYHRAYLHEDLVSALHKPGLLHRETGSETDARACWERALALLSRLALPRTLDVGADELTALLDGRAPAPDPTSS